MERFGLLWAVSVSKCHLISVGIAIVKIRQSYDFLVYAMSILYSGKMTSLYWNVALVAEVVTCGYALLLLCRDPQYCFMWHEKTIPRRVRTTHVGRSQNLWPLCTTANSEGRSRMDGPCSQHWWLPRQPEGDYHQFNLSNTIGLCVGGNQQE